MTRVLFSNDPFNILDPNDELVRYLVKDCSATLLLHPDERVRAITTKILEEEFERQEV